MEFDNLLVASWVGVAKFVCDILLIVMTFVVLTTKGEKRVDRAVSLIGILALNMWLAMMAVDYRNRAVLERFPDQSHISTEDSR